MSRAFFVPGQAPLRTVLLFQHQAAELQQNGDQHTTDLCERHAVARQRFDISLVQPVQLDLIRVPKHAQVTLAANQSASET